MPLSSLSSAILSHMTTMSNIPPPPLNNIPSLKASKYIDYGQLNTLCHIRGLQYHRRCSILSAHGTFMRQYPSIFLKKKPPLYSLSQREDERYTTKDKVDKSQVEQLDSGSHNIAVHIRKVHGRHTLYGKNTEKEKLSQLIAILKKLPVHRTRREHAFVWKMLKVIPELNSHLTHEYLKALSRNVKSETWVKGSTVDGNDGLYLILKGQARLKIRIRRSSGKERKSTVYYLPTNLHRRISSELSIDQSDPIEQTLKQWSTFGTLEVPRRGEPEEKYSVITEEDCEIIKFSANNFIRLKLERKNLEIKEKLKLINQCPYYKMWPALSLHELVTVLKWKKFPANHVIVESGNVISFVAFIKSGYCKVYRTITGLVRGQSKAKKVRKFVYMGELKEKESFGEISILLQLPFTCTIITGNDVEMAIIEEEEIHNLDPVTKQLMLQTAQPTYGHLTDEDVKDEYLKKEKQREWENFKDETVKKSLYYNGITPGYGRWNHHLKTVPRNLKNSLDIY